MTLPPAVQHVSASRTAAAAGKRALEDTRRPLKERLGLEEIIIGTNAQPAIVYAADLLCKGAAPTFFFFAAAAKVQQVKKWEIRDGRKLT